MSRSIALIAAVATLAVACDPAGADGSAAETKAFDGLIAGGMVQAQVLPPSVLDQAIPHKPKAEEGGEPPKGEEGVPLTELDDEQREAVCQDVERKRMPCPAIPAEARQDHKALDDIARSCEEWQHVRPDRYVATAMVREDEPNPYMKEAIGQVCGDLVVKAQDMAGDGDMDPATFPMVEQFTAAAALLAADGLAKSGEEGVQVSIDMESDPDLGYLSFIEVRVEEEGGPTKNLIFEYSVEPIF